ncbi:MAG: putative dsRNA-binding protein, partial [Alphaproteobacteria bacterium]|nr:putative dsRNA-binding protein [Alphaproteobacteria bacterium]
EAAAFGFVERNWSARMLAHAKPPRDAKTTLQEWALARGLPLPSYEMTEQTGPAHAPTITVCAVVEGLGRIEAQGRSRRVAEQEAARSLLEATATHEMKT